MSQDRVDKLVCSLSKHLKRSRRRGWSYLALIALLLGVSAVGFVLVGNLSINEPNPRQYVDLVGVDLNAVASCGRTVVAVGDEGVIGVSTDSGKSWQSETSRTTMDLEHVSFSKDCSNIVVAGDDRTYLRSSNQGRSWVLGHDVGTGDTNSLALSADGTTAVAVGDEGLLMVSYDRGLTWGPLLGLGSDDARDVVLTDDGHTMVIAGDDGMGFVVHKSGPQNEFVIPKGRASFAGVQEEPDLDVALVVEDEATSGALRTFVFGQGIFEMSEGIWQERSNARGIRDVVHRSGCFIAVGSSGNLWISSDGRKWDDVNSGQGERIYQIELSDDGMRAVARLRRRELLIGRRVDEGGCEGGFKWNLVFTRADHLDVDHVEGSQFIVVGKKRESGRSRFARSVVLSVDANSNANPSDLEAELGFFESSVLDDGEDSDEEQPKHIQAARTWIELGASVRDVFWGDLIMRGLLRVAVTVLFAFLAVHLFGLARYEFRLSTYYAARKDVIQSIDVKSFDGPASIDKIDQFMRAMSPEHIEERASSSGVTADHAMQIVRTVLRDTEGAK